MGFVAQSSAMDSIGPFLFIGVRFLLATLVVLPMAWQESRRSERPIERRQGIGLFWIGLVLFLGMALQQMGLMSTTVTNSGFLTGLYVIFTPILAVLFLRQWPHIIVWPGAMLSLGGIYLLSGGDLSGLKTGDLLTILCAVFWAAQVILIGQYGKATKRPLTLSAVSFGVCSLLALVVAVVSEPLDFSAIRGAAKEIVFAGVFSSGVAFTIQAIAQRHTTSAQAAIFLSSEALFAALFGALFLGERLDGVGYLGCGLMFAAMVLVEIVPGIGQTRDGGRVDG